MQALSARDCALSVDQLRATVAQCESSLKIWKKAFEIEHGRKPVAPADYQGRPRIEALLREYTHHKALLAAKRPEAEAPAAPVVVASEPEPTPPPRPPSENARPPPALTRKASFNVLALASVYGATADSAPAAPASARDTDREPSWSLPLRTPTPHSEVLGLGDVGDHDSDHDVDAHGDDEDGSGASASERPVESDDDSPVVQPAGWNAPQRKTNLFLEAVARVRDMQVAKRDRAEIAAVSTPEEPAGEDVDHQPDPAGPSKAPRAKKPKHDVNFRRMKLAGQSRAVRRAGGGQWGVVSNSFVRVSADADASSVLESSEHPFVASDASRDLGAALYDPGLELREAAALSAALARDPPPVSVAHEWLPLPQGWDDASVDAHMDALLQTLGHGAWKEGQREVCRRVIQGTSTLALLPTGGGKSLCYILPTVAYPGTLTLVVSPLVALMRDQRARLPEQHVSGALLTSHQTPRELESELERVLSGKARVLFISPERVVQPSFRALLARLPPVRLVCIDEAHCLSQWSHNFRTSYLLLRDYLLEPLQPRCVLALTATASPDALDHVVRALGIQCTVRASLLRPNLHLSVVHALDRRAELIRLLGSAEMREAWQRGDGRAIVYVMTRRDVEQISALLAQFGIPSSPYHADLERQERRVREEDFRDGKVRVMVCTVAFGMGIDVATVRVIVHFNMPKAPENYVQEVGRAGRDGLPARCVLLAHSEDLVRLRSLCFSEGIDAHCIRQVLVDGVCRGNGTLVMADVVKRYDVRLEVVATLLAWLHVDGHLRVLPEGHASYAVALFVEAREVGLSVDSDEARLLAYVTAHAKRPTPAAEWAFFNAAAAQAALPGLAVHATLERLKARGVLRYKKDHKAFVFEPTAKLRSLDDAHLTQLVLELHQRLRAVEQCNVRKLHCMWNAVSDALQVGADEAEGDKRLKAHLHAYFAQGTIDTPVDYAQQCIVDAASDKFLRGDIVTLLNNARDSVRTGRQAARILQGVDSPEFPSSTWCTNAFWGKARHVDFLSLMALANDVILKNSASRG